MRKLLSIAICLAGLPGCVKLQMPDDMVSDTVEAGIDIYKEVKDSSEDTAHANLFSHSVVGAPDTPVADLRESCLTELEARTIELLNVDESEFTVVAEHLSITTDKAIASCTVSLASL